MKSSIDVITKRRDRLLELLDLGKTQAEARDILKDEGFPADRNTIWRDLEALKVEWKQANVEDFEVLRNKQLAILETIEKVNWMGTVPAETIREARMLRKDISSLLGLDAPTKSVSASVSMDEPDWVADFRLAAQGLTEEDFPQIWEFMRNLPRKPRVIDASCFPPPMKELP
jgi:hypothetical protein